MDGAELQPAPAAGGQVHRASSRALDSNPDAGIGRILDGRYRLDAVLGHGGMGYVYRATHTRIGKPFAIKVLRPRHATEPGVVERFLREARLASVLEHPNIVDINDYGELPEGGAYYVMELLSGRTLAARIDEDGPIEPGRALSIAVQICRGLECAHEQGIVHRDLKPDNVFLVQREGESDEPRVKLIDFGIARAQSARITATGAVLGTPEYMSPEQAQGEDVDARADLYALGVIVFEMLTGLVPFCSEDVTKVIYSHIHGTPPTLASVAAPLRRLERTDAVLSRLLAKSPRARPSSAARVAELLDEAMHADLGPEQDTSPKNPRSTLAIGSGGIAGRAEAPIDPAPGSWEPRADWSSTSDAAAPVHALPSRTRAARSRAWGPIVGVLAVTALVCTGVGLGWSRGWWSSETTPATRPDAAVPAAVAPLPSSPSVRSGRGVTAPPRTTAPSMSVKAPQPARPTDAPAVAPGGTVPETANADAAVRAPRPVEPSPTPAETEKSESNATPGRSKRRKAHSGRESPRSAPSHPVDTEPAAVPTSSVVRGPSGDLKDPFASQN